MTILFSALIILMAYHFIFERLIAPTLRLSIRFQLFRLRDDLRSIQIESPELIDRDVFNYLQTGLNTTIQFLSKVDFAFIYRALEAIESDQGLRKRVERRIELLDNHPSDEIKKIRDDAAKYFGRALLINTGGWMIYLFPIILSIILFSEIKSKVQRISYVPENEIDAVVPPEYFAFT